MDNFEKVKSHIGMTEYLEHRVIEIKKDKALCPFHDDHNPSFRIFKDNLSGHCFSCGTNADVIDLEMQIKGYTSPFEALKSIAQDFNITLEELTPEQQQEIELKTKASEILKKVCQEASREFQKGYDSNYKWVARFLLHKKAIDKETASKHQIGITSDKKLCHKVLNAEELKIARQINIIDSNGDFVLAGRILFPVWNYGKVVFLSGRRLSRLTKPKYKHLKNSELITKQPAFVENLNKDYCIIVEDISSAMALNTALFNATATLGTSGGGKALEKAKAKLYFLMDSDEAGQRANYGLAKQYRGYCIKLDDSRDIDEILAEEGGEAFKQLITTAKENATYYLDTVIECEGKIEALKQIALFEIEGTQKPELNRVPSDSTPYTDKLAKKHKITPGEAKKDKKLIIERISQAEETKQSPDTDNIELLEDSKKAMHPGIDFVNGNLIYGHGTGGEPLFITSRTLSTRSQLPGTHNIIEKENPPPLLFSTEGIKSYIEGSEEPGEQLWQDITNYLSRFVSFKEHWQPGIVALWIMGTYLYPIFAIYPLLIINSLDKRCGKTRLLELIAELVFRCIGIEISPSVASLYRSPELSGETLVLDEAEDLGDIRRNPDRVQILNASYKRGGYVSRQIKEGEELKTKRFNVYRPSALASITLPPPTISDRGLLVTMERKEFDVNVERLSMRNEAVTLQQLRDRLHIWALTYAPEIEAIYRTFPANDKTLIPAKADDRLRDSLEVLISITLGGITGMNDTYPNDLFQSAIVSLTGSREAVQKESAKVQALKAFHNKFQTDWQDHKFKIVKSEEAREIFSDSGMDWVEKNKQASNLLNSLGIKGQTHRVSEAPVWGWKIESKDITKRVKPYLVNESTTKDYLTLIDDELGSDS